MKGREDDYPATRVDHAAMRSRWEGLHAEEMRRIEAIGKRRSRPPQKGVTLDDEETRARNEDLAREAREAVRRERREQQIQSFGVYDAAIRNR